jgi:hypothetical protein
LPGQDATCLIGVPKWSSAGMQRKADPTALRDLPTEEELEEMEEAERERLEAVLAAITLAHNPPQVREEVARLEQLAQQAKKLEPKSIS